MIKLDCQCKGYLSVQERMGVPVQESSSPLCLSCTACREREIALLSLITDAWGSLQLTQEAGGCWIRDCPAQGFACPCDLRLNPNSAEWGMQWSLVADVRPLVVTYTGGTLSDNHFPFARPV